MGDTQREHDCGKQRRTDIKTERLFFSSIRESVNAKRALQDTSSNCSKIGCAENIAIFRAEKTKSNMKS